MIKIIEKFSWKNAFKRLLKDLWAQGQGHTSQNQVERERWHNKRWPTHCSQPQQTAIITAKIRCHRLDNQIELPPHHQWKVKKKQLSPPLVCFLVSAHFIRCHRQDNQIELPPLYSERWRKNNYHHPWCAFLVSAHFIRCHRLDNQIELPPIISERWRKNNYHHPWCAFWSPPTLSDVTD